MYEQEKQRATHLLVLIVYTIFTIVLAVESYLMGWEPGAVVLLLLGLAASWVLHITGKVPASIRLWLYYILTMLAFFFYGIHESSIYDLATLMVMIIILYSATEMYSFIRLCVLVYILTLCYDFVFVLGGSIEITVLSVTRILFHLLIVCTAGQLIKITIQKQKDERKNTKEKIAELEETNRRTEDFMANVSHELRTPINAVTGITSVMLKNEEDEEKRKDLFAIQMAGYRLFNQIEDILDYTEIDTGRITVSEDNYMISSVVNDIITENRLSEKRNMQELIFDIDAGIPSVLFGDGKKIKKVLKHLIDNAVKFTRKGGVYVRIYTIHKSYGVNLCIQVKDTGIGIAKEDLGRITERFYQSNGGRNRRAGGLGLGLPIVYGMVQAMQGFIQVESTEGKGTTVCVSVPQKVVDEAPCMVVNNRKNLCLACFLMSGKYSVPEVREFYNAMISHMVQGLDLLLYRVSNIDELENLSSTYRLTHLFIGKEEYEENQYYFEDTNQNTEVIVVADDGFSLPKGSRVKILRKPFYCLSVINILNTAFLKQTETLQEKHMICPGVRVLVVDDEPMNLMVAEGMLKNYRMNVKTADSGKKAVRLCENADFDLVFLDHMMPEMDGVETLKQLRKLNADSGRPLTIIAFTANAVSGAREMFLREGFDEFISKPIELFELERVLRKVLPKSAIMYEEESSEKNTETGPETHSGTEPETDIEMVSETVSETDKKAQTEEQPVMAALESMGIHTRSGLQYSQGDRDFYLELLTKFADGYAPKETELNDFFHQENWDDYRIQVHALKSSSKLIGADTLSTMAREAEEAASRHDADYIKKHHEALLEQYKEVAHHIMEVMKPSEDAETKVLADIEQEELLERLKEVTESLGAYEIDRAEEQLSELTLTRCGDIVVRELLHDVCRDVEDFEFDAAILNLENIISSTERGENG